MPVSVIEAYDSPKRIESYDSDMDIMHPNRHKMLEVALDTLPFARARCFHALDLGVGTGIFTKRLLETFPNATVLAIDGASSMVEAATERLGDAAERVEFRVGDFGRLDDLLSPTDNGHLVISSYALHHLDRARKAATIRRSMEFLEPGGWFINADIIIGETALLETRFQQLRVDGIVRRAGPTDCRFGDAKRARAFLDNLELAEGDQPLPLREELRILATAGLMHTGVIWLEYREAVTGGIKDEQ